MKVLSLILLIQFAGVLASSNLLMRCLNQPKSVEKTVKQSSAVFTGEVLEIRSGRNYREARLRVERIWKGVDDEEIIVSFDSTAESPHYRVGEKYLVFANTLEGALFTGACSRTKKIEHADEDLKQLGEGRKPSTPKQ